MNPLAVGNSQNKQQLRLNWPDGREQLLDHAELRRQCPCSQCRAFRLQGLTVKVDSRHPRGRVESPGLRPATDLQRRPRTRHLPVALSLRINPKPVGASLLAKAVGQSHQCRMCRRLRGQASLLQGIFGGHILSEHPRSNVGAGLLAKAVCRSTLILDEMASSRASPLLQ